MLRALTRLSPQAGWPSHLRQTSSRQTWFPPLARSRRTIRQTKNCLRWISVPCEKPSRFAKRCSRGSPTHVETRAMVIPHLPLPSILQSFLPAPPASLKSHGADDAARALVNPVKVTAGDLIRRHRPPRSHPGSFFPFLGVTAGMAPPETGGFHGEFLPSIPL